MRTVILIAGLPGYDFSGIADVCAGKGMKFVHVGRNKPGKGAKGFATRLCRLNRRILDLAGYGWADTRMLRQDASLQNIDRRFEHWAGAAVQERIAKAWSLAPADNGRPIVVASDAFGPTLGIWARALRRLDLDVRPLFIGLTSDEALAQFAARIPTEVGIPGAPQLWLKHTLIGLYQLLDQKDGCLARWTTPEDGRQQFPVFLEQGGSALTRPEAEEAAAAPGQNEIHVKRFDLKEALDSLLNAWPAMDRAERRQDTTALLNSLRATAALYNDVADVPQDLRPFRVPPVLTPELSARPVILHYHIFKNAGTSVDVMLKENFGQFWEDREFLGVKDIPGAVRDWVNERPLTHVFSSHSMVGPVPEIEGVTMLPVIFMRHPIDRVKSSYLFERRQTVENPGTILARNSDFPGYVEAKLKGGKFGAAIMNYSSFKLASFVPGAASNVDRALLALERLPFVGLVEEFELSIQRLEQLVQALYPEVVLRPVLRNATRDPAEALEDRLTEIRAELGDDLYTRLEMANQDDLAVFERLTAFYRQQKTK